MAKKQKPGKFSHPAISTPPSTGSLAGRPGVVRVPRPNVNGVVIFNLVLQMEKPPILLLMLPSGLLHPIKRTGKNSVKK